MGCVCVKDNTESELVLNDKNKNLRLSFLEQNRMPQSTYDEQKLFLTESNDLSKQPTLSEMPTHCSKNKITLDKYKDIFCFEDRMSLKGRRSTISKCTEEYPRCHQAKAKSDLSLYQMKIERSFKNY